MIQARITCAAGGFRLEAAFEAPGAGITGIFGPSGAGKTTLLRCLAGLEPQCAGEIRVGEAVWLDSARKVAVATHRRGVGMVAQDAGLFAHLDVRGNLAYGLRRTPAGTRTVALEEVVDWFGLASLLSRMPVGLSGGERQRVAIARAALASPRLLLLDEPVSALDEARRNEVLPCLARMQRARTLPVLLVTHTLGELARFADHIVQLEAGRVVAGGPLREMLPRLGTAGDAVAVLEGTVVEADGAHALVRVTTAFGDVWAGAALGAGTAVRLVVAAREVSLGLALDPGSSILNQLPARVAGVREAQPGQLLVTLSAEGGEGELLALVTRRSWEQLGLGAGAAVYARVKGVNVGV